MSENKGITLITRPKYKSEILAQKLQEQGYETLINPLFEVRHRYNLTSKEIALLQNPQAILITSDNAIPALKKLALAKDVKIMAVGKITADKIIHCGYKNVSYAQNSAQSLQELALNKLNKDGGMVVYLAGELVTLDLAQQLHKHGFKSKKITVYSIDESKQFEPTIIEKIHNNQITQILVYSQNTALILHRLILKHKLLECFKGIKILCLSKKIADYCLDLGFQKIGNINEILNHEK
ncbi:MAG: uroporphyrinogen-III synthase [Proteobacteria bacterium]|nr:uroporphyrinogen-III synthase [Pseudomonadota bacterium]